MRRLLLRLVNVFRPHRAEPDLAREVDAHLALLEDDFRRQGLGADEARLAARRAFGGVEQTKDQHRDARSFVWLDDARRDLQYAARTLRKSPGFTAIAVLTLALGVGATAAIFSVVDAVLLRPLSYPDPDRLVVIAESIPARADIPVNAMHFLSWQADTRSFDQMALVRDIGMNLTGSGEPELLAGARVSSGLFTLLGVRMQLGRAFTPEEDRPGRDRVVVLDDALWRRRFGADPNAIGRIIALDGEPYEIVGVLPRDFRFPWLRSLISLPTTAPRPQIWKPYALRDAERNPIGQFNNICLARLKPTVTAAQAALEIDREQAAIASRLTQRMDLHALVKPLHTQIVERSRAGLVLLFAAVGIVLLVGAINVTNLLLVKTLGRRRELAVRRALGAGRGRLVRQMLAESFMLCGLGGLAGVAVAYAAVQMILIVAPADVPRLDEVALDTRVLLLTLVVSGVAGLLIGLAPAWRSAGAASVEAMTLRPGGTTEGRGAGRLRSLLVGVEVALSGACLIVGGLLLHSLVNLLTVDTGLDLERVVTVVVSLSGPSYRSLDARTAFRRAALERVQSLPGVSSVALSHNLPLTGIGANSALTLEGTTLLPQERPVADVRMVNPEYFRTWGIPLKDGRLFDVSDGAHAVALVSEYTARHAWGGATPIGKRFRLGLNASGPLFEVIGVVGDVRGVNLNQAPAFAAYVPYWQQDAQFVSLAIKTRSDPAAIASAVRAAIRDVDSDLPMPAVRTMDEVVAASTAERRFQTNLVLLFAAAATLLAGLGIYGVLSYSVTRRTSEIGIRLALGAAQGEVRRMIVKDAARLAAGGLLAGVPLALVAASSLRGLLFGVAPQDPATVIGVCVVLTAAACVAAYLPARRASRVDPIVSLRCE